MGNLCIFHEDDIDKARSFVGNIITIFESAATMHTPETKT
jgi:hypothetical protein